MSANNSEMYIVYYPPSGDNREIAVEILNDLEKSGYTFLIRDRINALGDGWKLLIIPRALYCGHPESKYKHHQYAGTNNCLNCGFDRPVSIER